MSIALNAEIDSRSDKFRSLITQAYATRPPPSDALQRWVHQKDTYVVARCRPIIPHDGEPRGETRPIVTRGTNPRDAVLLAPKSNVAGTASIDPMPTTLDAVFVESDTTDEIYNLCGGLVDAAAQGASTCVLCYGQTGSGKTHTSVGLLTSIARDVVAVAAKYGARATMAVLELRHGRNVDLLSPDGPNVQVVESVTGDIQLLGAAEHAISGEDDLRRRLAEATAARSTATTQRNATSSRSHMVVRFSFHASAGTRPGLIFVADLAGSESTADSAGHDPVRQQETKFINTSLMVLKDCIRARSTAGKTVQHLHIPFRRSALTLMLRDCFELKVRRPTTAVVIACVSPLLRDARQTINTLRYAALLASAPSAAALPPSEDDPQNWDRAKALAFLASAARGRLPSPEEVLPEGGGLALVTIPETTFLQRLVAQGMTEKSAKMVYGKIWAAVVDARTKARERAKENIAH